MGKIKQIDSALLALGSVVGVVSVIGGDTLMPNLLVVDYDPFPQPINVLVGTDGLAYIMPSEVFSLARDLTIYEIKHGLDFLDISILEY